MIISSPSNSAVTGIDAGVLIAKKDQNPIITVGPNIVHNLSKFNSGDTQILNY